MPGFSQEMIPALRLDYGLIGRRVDAFKKLLDDATQCDMVFQVPGKVHRFTLDLRHRKAHASGGVFPVGGVAGNLPSGESYIVPYEGEVPGVKSRTRGEIPVQFANDIVTYRVEENRAVEVITDNPASHKEAAALAQEPAYGNISELGLGVLGDFGLVPTGEILLDEKLGVHIAFGRSEHFGGQVGPTAFSSPDAVVHIDRVYIPELQPLITIQSALLKMADGSILTLMRNGKYAIDPDSL
jgi:leucyl aminopeptidase (aminopeptidase T)